MAAPPLPPADLADLASAADPGPEGDLIEEEMLVEEISIDGMCGVY